MFCIDGWSGYFLQLEQLWLKSLDFFDLKKKGKKRLVCRSVLALCLPPCRDSAEIQTFNHSGKRRWCEICWIISCSWAEMEKKSCQSTSRMRTTRRRNLLAVEVQMFYCLQIFFSFNVRFTVRYSGCGLHAADVRDSTFCRLGAECLKIQTDWCHDFCAVTVLWKYIPVDDKWQKFSCHVRI